MNQNSASSAPIIKQKRDEWTQCQFCQFNQVICVECWRILTVHLSAGKSLNADLNLIFNYSLDALHLSSHFAKLSPSSSSTGLS